MSARDLLADGALSVVAGLAASKAMSPVTTKIYEAQSEEAKKKETEASYGVAYNVAVEKLAGLVGVEPSEQQVRAGGQALHYGLGVGLTPVYMALRRKTSLTPWGAGLAAGTGLYLVLDEALNPLLGFTPPPGSYPPITHLRGLAGHVVLGLTLAAVVEAGWAALGRRP